MTKSRRPRRNRTGTVHAAIALAPLLAIAGCNQSEPTHVITGPSCEIKIRASTDENRGPRPPAEMSESELLGLLRNGVRLLHFDGGCHSKQSPS